MVEKLCEHPNDVLHFDDKTLTNNCRLLWNKRIRLCLLYQAYQTEWKSPLILFFHSPVFPFYFTAAACVSLVAW